MKLHVRLLFGSVYYNIRKGQGSYTPMLLSEHLLAFCLSGTVIPWRCLPFSPVSIARSYCPTGSPYSPPFQRQQSRRWYRLDIHSYLSNYLSIILNNAHSDLFRLICPSVRSSYRTASWAPMSPGSTRFIFIYLLGDNLVFMRQATSKNYFVRTSKIIASSPTNCLWIQCFDVMLDLPKISGIIYNHIRQLYLISRI